jgi:hypothetical protein
MEMKRALFGGDYDDYHDAYIKPVLDFYQRQIDDIQSSGMHGELARRQAMDDAMGDQAQGQAPGATAVGNIGATPDLSSGGLKVTNAGYRAGPGPASLAGTPQIKQLGPDGPGSAAFIGMPTHLQPSDLQNAGAPDTSRYSAISSGGGITTGPTLGTAAKSAPFNQTQQDLDRIWKQQADLAGVRSVVRGLVGAILDSTIPEERLPEYASHVASRAIEASNGASDLADELSLRTQYEKALMRRMTDMTVQQGLASATPAQVRGFMIK